MADVNELEKTILGYIKTKLVDDDGIEVGVDSPLISGGVVDSFSMVSLKSFLERTYKIRIPDARATPAAFDSVSLIAKLVAEFQK